MKNYGSGWHGESKRHSDVKFAIELRRLATEKHRLVLDVNEKYVRESPSVRLGNAVVMVNPPVGVDYWVFKVRLYEDQAMIAFPKFGQMGISFLREERRNINLPAMSSAEDIWEHIKPNKKYMQITKKMGIKAIQMLQGACKEHTCKGNRQAMIDYDIKKRDFRRQMVGVRAQIRKIIEERED